LKIIGGLLLLGIAHVAYGQYAGPALLTRGEAPGASARPSVAFRPFVEIVGLYDTGLTAVTLTESGELKSQASAGARLTFGIGGTRRWRHTDLGITYRGSISHYIKQHYYDSMSHSLLLGVNHEFSPRIRVSFSEAAGMFSRDFGLLGMPDTSLFDPSTASVPTTDYFDNRTIYFTSLARLIIQRTSRLSFALGGQHVLNRRRSKALQGVSALTATGDVQYRLSRRSTLGANYTFTHYLFTNSFGSADIHTASGAYAWAFSPHAEFSGYLGVMRPEIKSLQNAPTDPVIAALLGISQSAQVIHSVSYSPTFGARISRQIRNSIVYLIASHGITPGNGLFLTSTSTTASGGYSYTGLRRWRAGASVNYSRSRSLAGFVGRYDSAAATALLSRRLTHSIYFTSSYSVRRYASPNYSNYGRVVQEAAAGFGFAPGDTPLRFW
jgi:hypothetical protein